MPDVGEWLRGSLPDLAAAPWAWRWRSANADAPEPRAIPRVAQPEPELVRPPAPPAPKRANITSAMLEERRCAAGCLKCSR
eukprot:14145622-Alexandrium_andersonii.AAC.1